MRETEFLHFKIFTIFTNWNVARFFVARLLIFFTFAEAITILNDPALQQYSIQTIEIFSV